VENEMSDERGIPVPDTGIIFYQTEDGQSRIQVRLQDGTVWLNQRLLAELYQVAVPTINNHIATIFSDHELTPDATIRKYLIVQTEGLRQVERQVDFYNLDMILAIGYRVCSHQRVLFRRWATERLKEHHQGIRDESWTHSCNSTSGQFWNTAGASLWRMPNA
jgi:hypothetical protein